MAHSGENACSYDVFISFCGEDTRNGFTDHLYRELLRAGIRTFRDNDAIHKGGELKTEFETSIKESRASIVVLSKNYAASAWCLDELLLILQQKTECNHFLLPVFYGVDPTDVRNQRGSFAIEVKNSPKWTADKVSQWKTALKEVANLAGHVVSGPETTSLKEIVDTIYNELDLKEVHLPPNLIGMATHNDEINSWLDEETARFFIITGMGGSGKTTLAKYIYSLHKRYFEYVSFIGDIGRRCEKGNSYSGILEVQEQLLKDILVVKERKIPCVSRGTPLIENALKTKRALIILDDIVGETQLVDLLGTMEINYRSKIIITTTDNPDNWCGYPHWRCQKYKMHLLRDKEALELLCRHAFRSEIPKEGFEEVVLRAVRYCEGNPLALEVLGSSLYKNDTIEYWESFLRLFGKDIDARIYDVLVRSYESLPSNTTKELFLDIACFFNDVDKDYVVKILDPDSAEIGIKALINRCLISVSPSKKLMMHKLVQKMGEYIVRQESRLVAKRSRVWLSSDSYKILTQGKGSETIEGLALDLKRLTQEDIAITSQELKTEALESMDNLKLLQLKFVELNGSYENFPEYVRWLCWFGFHLTSLPSGLNMRRVVAIDMSYSKLEVFEPPEVLHLLQILNLKDSHNLVEIRNIFNIPRLETLILWNCFSLVHVCKTIGGLTSLSTLNMTGCKNLFNREQITQLAASTSAGVVTEQPSFSFPCSLGRLFLKDCLLDCTDSFPLSFGVPSYLQYLNLGGSQFESLPCFDHMEHLRVLDLSFCSRLKCLIGLPNTLAELYVYDCESLERITFRSPRFSLQEIGYEGCISLNEVEGFFKLVPVAKLDETEMGHMKWLKEYENHEMPLAGDDELTLGRSCQIQMLYEFGIMSTSLPDIIEDPRMSPTYISHFLCRVSFVVPSCPKNKKLQGINVTIKYYNYHVQPGYGWFCKIETDNGVDLMYNPKVYGAPEFESCTWLSYWPIGNKLNTGDQVEVSIVDICTLIPLECGVRLVYSDEEPLENKIEWEEVVGGDLSGFQLSTGAYFLCHRDLSEILPGGSFYHSPMLLTSVWDILWFRNLVRGTIDHTEIRGWRKTGRPKRVNQSNIELKTVRCIIHGPQLEDFYNIKEFSKSSYSGIKVLSKSSYSGSTSTNTVPFSSLFPKPFDLDNLYITDDDEDGTYDQGASKK